ncbi:XRE family transcriptional regulator [Streptomyces sp. NPDC049597]|uniref:XRE family transcriptional regulator n=1 Tax=Streptomyces sp. NPDC049597 TaxID=3155276 RepID=UPI00341820CE
MDKARIRKWEVGGVVPDADNQRYLAEALGVPVQAVEEREWPHWLPSADGGVVPLGPTSTVPALREALNATMNRSRRHVLSAISGTALISLSGTWAGTESLTHTSDPSRAGKPVGDELVALLEESTAKLAKLATEQRQHTAALIDAHLTTVTDLIETGRHSGTVTKRLHTLAGNLSQTVAWHRFDSGLHAEAARYWIAGLHSAHASGDRDMGAALLGDLAYQASWRKDPATAEGILERAISRTEHPAARSLLHLRLARALAAQGEQRATLRALKAAEHLLGTASGVPKPAWCAWLSEADLAVDSGQCLLDLGDTARAHSLIREGQKLLPSSRAKTRGVFLAYQAKSHLDLHEPELAAAAATESLQLALRIGAPRCIRLVHDLIPQFQDHQAAEGVPALLHLAAA